MQRIADPRKTAETEARKLMANLPAVVWLSYGVHGNEISSPDAALLTAYHLLASRNDKLIDDVLAKVVVLIDPTQNPDGRDRFVNYFDAIARTGAGRESCRRRAQRAVARRARQSLPVRPESRLDRADAARSRHAGEGTARVAARWCMSTSTR